MNISKKFVVLLILAYFNQSYSNDKHIEVDSNDNFIEVGSNYNRDFYYRGALIDYKKQLSFYANGKLKQATLKEDLIDGDIVYKQGNTISFYENGEVERAILKNDVLLMGLTFIKDNIILYYPNGRVRAGTVQKGGNPNGSNLKLNEDIDIRFSNDGFVIQIMDRRDTSYGFEVLGYHCIIDSIVRYDHIKDKYQLYTCVLKEPLLVGMIPTQLANNGHIISSQAIIVPIGTGLRLESNNPPMYNNSNDSVYDFYKINNSIELNGVVFSKSVDPVLIMNGGLLYGVIVRQKFTYNGHIYNPNDIVLFNKFGNVIIP